MNTNSKIEVDTKTGLLYIGYGAGSSPTFNNLTLTGVLTATGAGTSSFGGNLTVSGTGTSSVAGGLNILSNSSATGAVDIGADARASNLRLSLNAAAGNDREIITYTAGLQRWKIGVTGTAESGSNAGSNWILQAYADNGSTSLGNAISITRSTLATTLAGNLTVSGTGTSSVAGKLAVGTTAVIGNSQFTLKKATDKNLNIDAAAGAVSGISIYAGTDADAYTGLQVDGDKLYLNVRSGGNVLVGTTTDVAAYKLNVYGATAANVIAANGVTPDGTKTGGVFGTALGGTGAATGSYAFAGDIAGRFVFNAYGNNFIYEAASMQAEITTGGNTDRNLHVAALDFYTKGTGSNIVTRNMRLTGTGNLLLKSDGIDSGNGKLQLATHTTSAGGIGFGTDTSLYREAAGTLSINHSGGDSRLYFYNAGTAQGRVESASSNFFVTAMAGSLILRSGGATTALTLDSSQAATFAKGVTLTAGSVTLTDTYTLGWGNGTAYVQGSVAGNFVKIGTAGSVALTLDGSQNATFAGSTLSLAPSANDALVNVKGRATGTNQAASTSRGASLSVTNLNNTDNNCEAISFQNSNELAIASIVAQNVSHTGRTGNLYFNISNGAAPAEALNIAADKTATFAGNVTVAASKVFTHNGQNGYTLALSTTADRAFKFEGSASGNDYTTSFTNAGAGKHNLSCSGSIAIGNTVAAAAGVASTHKVTISIGGSTYYLLASNV